MSNIVVPEAATWSKEEYEQNMQVLESMGMSEEIGEVKRLRKKGLQDPGIAPAGLDTLQETDKGKK